MDTGVDTSALVLAKEERGRSRGSIDRPDDRRGGSANESITGENASHIRYPRYVYRGTFIARAEPRRVIDKRVHLLSRLIKFRTPGGGLSETLERAIGWIDEDRGEILLLFMDGCAARRDNFPDK